ncbi:PA0069 family radical SAM protein [Ferrovibrio sp.]|uniref:PA0069 family radical SAM protein n=1 Tax=Ferrovibrio sp. TaxID=1917215 RepID=UPI0025C07A78|nr:PA0069 family radical SAM protein [Ferrovibrio sp.]
MKKIIPRAISTEADQARPDARRGRGALSDVASRYDTLRRQREDDGWGVWDEPEPLKTVLHADTSRSIIAWNKSPDIPFDRSINPYRGCEHGCVYCFARPSHAYLGFSPGLDFETQIMVKRDAAALLQKELAARGYQPAVMNMGTNTDPYQPVEREERITRSVVEVLRDTCHPLGIVTKNFLVTRDIDLFSAMARDGLVKIFLSVTTLDRQLARRMEPRASTPPKRLEAIQQLAEAGVPVGVMVAPIIPMVNDMEIERILEAAYAAGAREAGYVLLRLPLELKEIWREWLAEHYPDRAARVMKLIQQARGGRDYVPEFGNRMRGEGPYADLIAQRFGLASRKLGFNEKRLRLRTDLFKPPSRDGRQGSLF